MTKVNLVHFIGSLGAGGAENQVVQLLNHLDSQRFNKHLVVLRHKIRGFKDRLREDVRYHSLEYRRRYFPIGIYKLIRYLKEYQVDVFHCHMYDPSKLGVLANTIARVPVVVTTEHGKNLWKVWHHHLVEKYFINRAAHKRVAVSEDIRKLRIKNDGVKPNHIIIIPNGVTIPGYTASCDGIPTTVGSLGRLVEAKDYPCLFEAVKLVRNSGYDLQVRIAGEGHLKNSLEKYISDNSMTEFVKLVGFRKPEEFLKEIHIFAMSSIREGLPVALLEAMSFGLPVVATDVGGIPDVIQLGVNGLLSPPEQPQALAANLIRIIEDSVLRIRLGSNARKKIIKEYDIRRIADRYAQLYIELLNNNGK